MTAVPRKPPKWWSIGVVVVAAVAGMACAVIVWASVAPVIDFPLAAMGGWALVICGVGWLILAVIGWFRYHRYRASLIAPALVLGTGVLIGAGIPFEVGFRLSKPDLEAAVADCIERENLRIGVYHVWRIEVVDAGCMFYTNGGLVDSVGIAYMPGGVPDLGPPRTDGEIGYFPIEGDWYRFVKQF